MGTLPVLSGREVVKVLERLGWSVARRRGSHIVLVKPGHIATLSVPDHKEVSKGTLRTLIRAAGLTAEAFAAAVQESSARRPVGPT